MRTSEVRIASVLNQGGTFALTRIWPGEDDISLEWVEAKFSTGYQVLLANSIDNLPMLPDDVIEAVALGRLIDPATGIPESNIYLSTWQNPLTKLWTIDISICVATETEAQKLGAENGRATFWDIRNGSPIEVFDKKVGV